MTNCIAIFVFANCDCMFKLLTLPWSHPTVRGVRSTDTSPGGAPTRRRLPRPHFWEVQDDTNLGAPLFVPTTADRVAAASAAARRAPPGTGLRANLGGQIPPGGRPTTSQHGGRWGCQHGANTRQQPLKRHPLGRQLHAQLFGRFQVTRTYNGWYGWHGWYGLYGCALRVVRVCTMGCTGVQNACTGVYYGCTGCALRARSKYPY